MKKKPFSNKEPERRFFTPTEIPSNSPVVAVVFHGFFQRLKKRVIFPAIQMGRIGCSPREDGSRQASANFGFTNEADGFS